MQINKSKEAGLGFIFITILLDVIGFGIIIPVMPGLIMELGVPTLSEASKTGGLMMFTYSFAQFVFSPVIGNLSDQYGRKKVLLTTILGFGIDYIFLAFTPSIKWLFVGRLISGITGASITTASAYISDISTPENKAKNFGMVGAAFGIGFVIGPVIGGLLAKWGLRTPFFGAAALTLLNFLYGLIVLPESLSIENRRKFSWKRANPVGSFKALTKNSLIAGLALCLTLLHIASHSIQSNWSYFVKEKFDWDSNMIGYSLGLVGVCVMFVQGFLTSFCIKKWGEKNCIIIGLLIYMIGFSFLALAGNTFLLFLGIMIYCFGGLAMPSVQALISQKIPPNEQGEIQGAITSLVSITAIIGPLLMSNIFSYFSQKSTPHYFPSAPFVLSSFLTLVSVGYAVYHLKHRNIS